MKPRIPLVFVALALVGGACKKSDERAAPKAAEPAKPAEPDPAAPKAAEPAKEIADALAELEKVDAAEKARYDNAMRGKVGALVARTFDTVDQKLEAILASPHRAPGHAARDAHRHPRETLLFLGLTPEKSVVELGAGGGWFTEILAALLFNHGQLTVVSADPDGPADQMSTVYGKRVQRMLARMPELYGKVKHVTIAPPDKLELGPPGSADVVLAFREMHGWQRRGQTAAYLAAVHAVLKDGGVFGVEQHRAPVGADVARAVTTGYLPEAWVIDTVKAAGFELAERSEINANPRDTKDHEKGVWALPPSLDNGDKDRARYEAIGESDRMTLKFVKVAKP